MSRGKRLTLTEFVNRANVIHNNKYDYSLTIYTNIENPINIICPVHGTVEVLARNHIKLNSKNGCKFCTFESRSIKYFDFIERANIIHENKYKYKIFKDGQLTTRNKIVIECPSHGDFSQTINDHLYNKAGCPKCKNELTSILKTHSIDDFIKLGVFIHGNIYNYSKFIYIGYRDKSTIICKTHGEFIQSPMCHLQGCGCPKCTSQISKGQEDLFNFISSLTSTAILEDRINYPSLQLDITIPDKNLAIEYNGVYWHAINFDHSRSPSHLKDKLLKAQELGLRVINIYEDEWQNSRSHIEQIIKNALGVIETKIMARKCKIWSIDTSDPRWNTHVKPFFEKFHHQGLKYKPEGVAYCLTYNNIIQACAYFGSNSYHNQNDCELIRYATRADVKVVGGLSKLVTNFLRQNPEVKKIKSYCDARLFTGDGYRKAGFKFIEHSSPGFDVISGSNNNLVRKHRSCIIKNKLSSYFDEETLKSKTQMELAADLGWYVVPDCGQIVFEYLV